MRHKIELVLNFGYCADSRKKTIILTFLLQSVSGTCIYSWVPFWTPFLCKLPHLQYNRRLSLTINFRKITLWVYSSIYCVYLKVSTVCISQSHNIAPCVVLLWCKLWASLHPSLAIFIFTNNNCDSPKISLVFFNLAPRSSKFSGPRGL